MAERRFAGGGRARGAAQRRPLTARASSHGLGGLGSIIVTIRRPVRRLDRYLLVVLRRPRGGVSVRVIGAIPIYRWVFIFFFFLGSILPLQAVWTYGDVALGLMSFPNLIAILLMSGSVAALTRQYFSKEHKRYR